MHQVTFRGADRTVEAHEGETLLQAAQRNGLHIDSSCGGNGSCHQCRVVIHEGKAIRQGRPAVPRHKRGNEPVYLACQCEVRGDMIVEPAPVAGVRSDHPVASLLGWNVAEPGTQGPALAVYHQDGFTSGALFIAHDGRVEREQGFVAPFSAPGTAAPMPEGREVVVVGEMIPYVDCVIAGCSHLKSQPVAVLDFSGEITDPAARRAEKVATNAFLGSREHLAGAIDYVEWSPLKTRTVISTVGNAVPTGLSASGVMACVLALLRAGMCSPELQLYESRFTREIDGQRVAMIVGPEDEAQTPAGVVHTSKEPVVVGQGQLNAIRDASKVIAERLSDLAGVLVTTGEFGTCVPDDLIRALGTWNGEIEFVPHAAALGAARLAFAQERLD
ncbi:MAG: 2Fe-2S iron-sulfur cluster binding domain-containing protein [Planctomycetes bacterium]|nr:2Fe-2S iron-sulfur cluster binding domain-containing protein [Planctomycetota bacterium]